MRVAFVTHQFFPLYYTGVERLALNLVTQLQRMGCVSSIITSAAHSSGALSTYTHAGTLVVPLDVRRANLAEPWLHGQAVGRALGDVLDREQVDVVHVMHPMRLPQAFEEAHRRRIPVVSHVADFFYPCARVTMIRLDGSLCTDADSGSACVSACRIRAGVQRFEWGRLRLEASAAVISPSRFSIDLHALLGFDTSHWHHVPWGVDYALHRARIAAPGAERLVLGFIGTLLPHKGPHVAIEALRSIPEAPVELRLYGGSFHEHEYEASLRRLAADDGRISFRGAYDHADLPGLLAELDAVVIPSLWHENLPSVGLNAIASGIPLLASDVGGLRELIEDYKCGFSYGAGDATELGRLIARLAEDRGLLADARSRMGYPPGIEEEAWRVRLLYEAVAGR